jgi:DNA-directed RNA polymerase specialized sigma24 family protein
MTEHEFYELYNRWKRSVEGQRIRAYLRKCGADEDTANECFHLALTDYLFYLDAGKTIDKPIGWLGTNAWRKFLRMRKGWQSPPNNDDPDADDPMGLPTDDDDPSPRPAAGGYEVPSHDPPIEEVLDQPAALALSRLSERHREVLRLTLDSDPPMTEQEIADHLGLTRGTMVQYRFDARQQFRSQVEAIGYGHLLPEPRAHKRRGEG